MYFSDYHVHSHFSGDCEMIMEEAILKAIALGLNEIAFTDHVDYDYPDLSFCAINYDAYEKMLYGLQRRYHTRIY